MFHLVALHCPGNPRDGVPERDLKSMMDQIDPAHCLLSQPSIEMLAADSVPHDCMPCAVDTTRSIWPDAECTMYILQTPESHKVL